MVFCIIVEFIVKLFFILIIFVILFSGCSHNKAIDLKNEIEKKNEVPEEMPEWITSPPPNNELFIYGSGSGSSYQSSDTSAKQQIAHYFDSHIISVYREYMGSNQINDTEIFREYIDNKVRINSKINLPGISIEERYYSNPIFYSLAKLNLDQLKLHQYNTESIINAFLASAEAETNSGKKLRDLFSAASLIPQTIYPVMIKNKPLYFYLNNEINNVLDNIESDYYIRKDSEIINKKVIVVNLKSLGTNLFSIPFTFDTVSLKPDNNGNYYLDYDEFTDGTPFYLKLRIDVNSLAYPPELNENELIDAKEIIRNITGKMFKIFIEPPIKLKALISDNVRINGIDSDGNLLINKIKTSLLAKEIDVVSNTDEANMQIQINVQIFESSYNEHLGFCYKASGSIRISGSGSEVIVETLNDISTEENTKSFDKNKDAAALKAYQKICDLLVARLSNMTF